MGDWRSGRMERAPAVAEEVPDFCRSWANLRRLGGLLAAPSEGNVRPLIMLPAKG